MPHTDASLGNKEPSSAEAFNHGPCSDLGIEGSDSRAGSREGCLAKEVTHCLGGKGPAVRGGAVPEAGCALEDGWEGSYEVLAGVFADEGNAWESFGGRGG